MSEPYKPLYPWRRTKIDKDHVPTDEDWSGYDGNVSIGRIQKQPHPVQVVSVRLKMAVPVDFAVINDVLKASCRELQVERDRSAVMQIATLLIRLRNEGVHDREELAKRAAGAWAEAVFGEAGTEQS